MDNLQERLEETKSLVVHGEYQEASDKFTILIAEIQGTKDPRLANLFNHRGVARRMLRQYEDSLSDYRAALNVSQIDDERALAHVNIADIERVAHSDFPRAHSSLDEALTFSENGSLMHAKAVDQRGLVFVAQKDYDSAIKSYETARNICEALMKSRPGDKDTENRFGQVVLHLGVAYLLLNDSGKVTEAYESQLTALDIFARLEDLQGIVNSVATIGKIAMIKRNYPEAVKQYEKALIVLETTGYGRAITALSLDLAEAHLQTQESRKAISYLERFRDGVLGNEITVHDIELMKGQFHNLASLYESADLKITGFDRVRAIFD